MKYPSVLESQQKEDWKWHLQNAIQNLDELISFFGKDKIQNSPFSYLLKEEYQKEFQQLNHWFRFQVTPYYLHLARIKDKNCPILRQVLPSLEELQDPHFLDLDPLKEESNSPIPNLVHRYPDRVLWYVSHHCAVYCRFCTRKRKVSDPSSNTLSKNIKEILQYIRTHSSIKEVIISGGDPLSLGDSLLQRILWELKQIPHLYHIRIHTRMLATLPYRITLSLANILEDMYPITIVTHFNHPVELTDIVYEKVRLLRKHGVMIFNQSVLLKGVNNNTKIMETLILKLLQYGIYPYYLHHCDEVYGTSHFRTSLLEGIQILEFLRGRNPGVAIPTYMVDLPEGGGKIPVNPDYYIGFSEKDQSWMFYNYQKDPNRIYKVKEII